MEQSSEMVLRERLVAALLAIAGLGALAASVGATSLQDLPVEDYLLAIVLAGSIVLAEHYPIHLMRGTKIALINLPIFLATVLLPAPLAVAATGLGVLVANLRVRAERGSLPRDIVATVGQWMFMAFGGHQIVRLSVPVFDGHVSQFALLLLCAFLFLLFDLVVFALSQSFVFREPFVFTLRAVIREGAFLEVIQYLIAILGALAVSAERWAVVLLFVPGVITYIAFKNLKEMHSETMRILQDIADTVDLRDVYTGGHSKRVAGLVQDTLIQMQLAGPEAIMIGLAARLHDIGKIGIPDTVLLKPGKLTPEEMAIMQTHSAKGAELIAKYKDFARGAQMILHHHERWDGGGYPAGLKAHEIPFGARVIAVADSFDAMTSERPYRKALSTDQAIRILLEGRGKQWDADVVNAFVDLIMKRMEDQAPETGSAPQVTSVPSPAVSVSAGGRS